MSLRTLRNGLSIFLVGLAITGCANQAGMFPTFSEAAGSGSATASAPSGPPPPVIRQPVLPEYLVGCRGHVLVPALGMTFVARNGVAPTTGQYLREERLTVPYRVIRPGDRLSQDRNTQRLNVELDSYGRLVGLACG